MVNFWPGGLEKLHLLNGRCADVLCTRLEYKSGTFAAIRVHSSSLVHLRSRGREGVDVSKFLFRRGGETPQRRRALSCTE